MIREKDKFIIASANDSQSLNEQLWIGMDLILQEKIYMGQTGSKRIDLIYMSDLNFPTLLSNRKEPKLSEL